METKKAYQQRKKIEKERTLAELTNKLLKDDQEQKLDKIERSDLERDLKVTKRDLDNLNKNIKDDRDKELEKLGI